MQRRVPERSIILFKVLAECAASHRESSEGSRVRKIGDQAQEEEC